MQSKTSANREIRRLLVAGVIGQLHEESRGTYGYRSVQAAIRDLGLSGLPRRKARKGNLIGIRTSTNLVKRKFSADNPKQLWVTAITEHSLIEGTFYTCVVSEVFSRKALGGAIDLRAETTRVNQTFHVAWLRRKTRHGSTIHAVHGAQFTSWAVTSAADKYGLRLSLGTVGVFTMPGSSHSGRECRLS